MAPSRFNLKNIKRRSLASFRTERSTDSGNETAQSSSTLSTTGAITPPSNSSSNLPSIANGTTTPPIPPTRPTLNTSSSNRASVSGMSGLGMLAPNSSLPGSPYAPQILSIFDGTWVHQKILLIHGQIADPATQALEGTVTVTRPDDNLPPFSWPVCESHFKALIYLMPGSNRLRFEFTSPKLANNSSNPLHTTTLQINMVPPLASPPLQLVLLLAKDSPETFDAVPSRVEKEGNGLQTATNKFRMAAYLWQAYTSEQMHRNNLGRRVFRIEEEWMTGTSNLRDRETHTMRNEARVHVVRTEKTVAELRDLERAQQNEKGTKKDELFGIALEAVTNYFKPLPGQKQYVAALLLDSHWDKDQKTILAHAAVGGGNGQIQLAIMGSHALQSYPSCFEEVVPAFTDCTPTDTTYVANDCSESGSSWEAANIGIGAHLHEVGHLFGCPHQESGIMCRGYVTLNRSFTTREPFSTRTRSRGGLVLMQDECSWHRLDCLRFRSHPCFALPTDSVRSTDDSVQAWFLDNGTLILTAPSGVAYLEIYTPGQELCRYWQEFADWNGNGSVQRQMNLTEQDLRARLPDDLKKAKLKLSIKSVAGGSCDVEDVASRLKAAKLKMPNGRNAFRGSRIGVSGMNGSTPEELVLWSTIHQQKLLRQVKVYHGSAVDGLEFVFEDSTSQLFGKRGGIPGGSDFNLDTRRGEQILGFYVRSGFWIDGIAIITNQGRKSPTYGNPTGGSGHTLIPPRGYSIAGVSGSCADWLDGFGLLITR